MTDMKTHGVNTCFKLMLDVTSVSEYVLYNVDIRVHLELQPDKWLILTDNEYTNFKYNIKSTHLWVDQVLPYPEGLIDIDSHGAEQLSYYVYF